MTALSLVAIACVAVWLALVVVVQYLTPGQHAMRMGMSGLSTGRYGWIMKLAFVVRGAGALTLVVAISGSVPEAARSAGGMVWFALWGGASALLAAYDTDMPGDAPTAHGRAHALIALVAYVAAAAGVGLMSWAMRDVEATAGLARWALPVAAATAVLLVAQFAGFAAAARTPGRGLARYAGLLQRLFVGAVMLWTVLVAASL